MKSFHFDVPRLSLVRGSLFFFCFEKMVRFFNFIFMLFPTMICVVGANNAAPFLRAQRKKKKRNKKNLKKIKKKLKKRTIYQKKKKKQRATNER